MAGVFAASKVVDFLGDAISAASNMNETISKTSVILGKTALPALEKWAEAAADAFGLSKQQALDAAATFAVFGKSAGLAGENLSGFSTDLTELAADLASFYNTSPEDAIVAIGAALRGESEPIRRYGVLLDDATLRQRALKLGIIDTINKALTPQQRVLAAQAEIFAQTADAQGDFGRTSSGLAGTQKKLAAEFANLQVEIGEELLPVMLELANFALDELIPAIRSLVDTVIAIPKAILDAKDAIEDFLNGTEKGIGGLKSSGEIIEDLREQFLGMSESVAEGFRTSRDEADSGMDEIHSVIASGATKVASAADQAIVEPITEAMLEARRKAYQESRAIPGDLSRGLIDGMDDVKSGLTAVRELMENSLSDSAKITYLKGVLNSKELARGILDERADVRGAWLQIQADSQEQLELLVSGAADAAVDAGTTFAEQLRLKDIDAAVAGQAIRLRAAKALSITDEFSAGATAIGRAWATSLAASLNANLFRIDVPLSRYAGKMIGMSPPKEGPLKDIDKGGYNIGKAWIEGFNLGLGGDLRLPTMPGLSGGGAALGPMAGGASTVTNTWNLSVNGVPYKFDSKDDFIKALDAMSRQGGTDGRLPVG